MNASRKQVEEFFDSIVWKDIADFLTRRREGLRNELELPVTFNSLSVGQNKESSERIGGRCQEIRDFLRMKDLMLLIIDHREKEENDV